MIRLARQGLPGLVILVLACATADGEDRIVGEGFSLRVPSGFERGGLPDCGT